MQKQNIVAGMEIRPISDVYFPQIYLNFLFSYEVLSQIAESSTGVTPFAMHRAGNGFSREQEHHLVLIFHKKHQPRP